MKNFLWTSIRYYEEKIKKLQMVSCIKKLKNKNLIDTICDNCARKKWRTNGNIFLATNLLVPRCIIALNVIIR